MAWPDKSVTRRTFLSASILSARLPVAADPLIIETDLALLKGRYTAPEDFYVRNHYELTRSPERPALQVDGAVARRVLLTPADLSGLKRMEAGAVLECAGNPVSRSGLVSNGRWRGYSLKDVLALARPSAAARFLHLFGRDGYARCVPLTRVDADAMLATELEQAGWMPCMALRGALCFRDGTGWTL